MAPKKLKFKRAFKALRKGRNSGGGSGMSPTAGETPIVILRVQVLGCKDLQAKDRNGFSDPFVSVSILNTRYQTPVCKRTLSPTYLPKDATFDFPLYLSLADRLGAAEVVVWDKDVLRKDYLGEVAIPLEHWFEGRSLGFDDVGNTPFSVRLISTREGSTVTGTVQIKLGFVQVPTAGRNIAFSEVHEELVKRSRPSLVSAPPTEGVGTIRSHGGVPEFFEDLQDDGGISSDDSDSDSEYSDLEEEEQPSSTMSTPKLSPSTTAVNSPRSCSTPTPISSTSTRPHPDISTIVPPVVNLTSVSPEIPSHSVMKPSGSSSATSFLPKIKFTRRSANSSSDTSPSPESPTTATPDIDVDGTIRKKKRFSRGWGNGNAKTDTPPAEPSSVIDLEDANAPKKRRRRRKAKKGKVYSLGGANDIVGIVMLEVQSADDLPRWSNMTRTGWDMDPFVVISFGKKVFRTRVIRHSRNPVWDEKLLFHVRRYETAFSCQLAVLDWDKLSSNDYIGETSFDVKELVEGAIQPDPVTGLYPEGGEDAGKMKEYKLPLKLKDTKFEGRHNPVITFRAKYQPYAALRQQFWRQYLKQYDTDDTCTLSHLELTSMLDSLGSTLTHTTLNSFFTRFNKKAHQDELTFDEVMICLETELSRPTSEKRRVDEDDSLPDSSVSATPVLALADGKGRELSLDNLDFSGPPASDPSTPPVRNADLPAPPTPYPTERAQERLSAVAATPLSSAPATPYTEDSDPLGASSSSDMDDLLSPATPATSGGEGKMRRIKFRRIRRNKNKESSSSSSPANGSSSYEDPFERVINVRNCPLCHRPRLNNKAEMDIVTHLAVCASQDWNRVDKIVVSNFVTASQAQRKWYTKIISKVSNGDYRLGANSANIIVQNRMTGQLEEEKMQVYVRLGIRLLYKGAKSRMEGARARKLLKSLSIKQGQKYDDPESARDIPSFIQFHGLDVTDILEPLDSFKTFNQFFYRKLKPTARPIECPDDPYRLVSSADCRLMTFETVNEATRLWIKGREFSVARLLGDAYKGEADRFTGGALAIFRLAPQDYHRFHSPVEGTIGKMTYVSGEYYTVNPQAIRTALDVYGENARKIVPIDSPHFGRVMAVCIGAMMVGSIATTVDEGEYVQRGQEFGYFAFGGSTIVTLFEKGAVEWDEDLLINGRASLETLVRVGMGIGRGRPRAVAS